MAILVDTYGAPQCGCEDIVFESDSDLIEYLLANPDVMERIDTGHAWLKRD